MASKSSKKKRKVLFVRITAENAAYVTASVKKSRKAAIKAGARRYSLANWLNGKLDNMRNKKAIA